MKKLLMIFIFLIVPLNVFAYSKYLIPGGESIGISVNTDGLVVVGFYPVNGEYIGRKTLRIGDRITKINSISVNSISELEKIVDEKELNDNDIDIELIRNGKVLNTKLNIVKDKEIYKTGLYVKDGVIGIGTLTYIDPVTKKYGALGHEISVNDVNGVIEIKNGNIFNSFVNSIDKSRNGYVGSKRASISYGNKIGNVLKNSTSGIFGDYTSFLPNKEKLEIATYDDIKLSNAYILTVTNDKKISKYNISIKEKYNSKKNTQKAFGFEITDKSLINKTGGIVQGMSGSPIIQNNKVIGAVTNVVIDDVLLGYGISIITMLEESEK